MKQTLIIIGAGLLLLLAGVGAKQVVSPSFGGLSASGYSVYSNVTNGSSTVPTTATTTSPIFSANPGSTYRVVCNDSIQEVYIWQVDSNSVTGVALNRGIRLSPIGQTTSTETCADLSGFRGYVFGIAQGQAANVTTAGN